MTNFLVQRLDLRVLFFLTVFASTLLPHARPMDDTQSFHKGSIEENETILTDFYPIARSSEANTQNLETGAEIIIPPSSLGVPLLCWLATTREIGE